MHAFLPKNRCFPCYQGKIFQQFDENLYSWPEDNDKNRKMVLFSDYMFTMWFNLNYHFTFASENCLNTGIVINNLVTGHPQIFDRKFAKHQK